MASNPTPLIPLQASPGRQSPTAVATDHSLLELDGAPHHSRGYRELRSKAEMRKLLDRQIVEQNRQCAICQVAFTNYSDIVPDHIDPRGMGGSRRDDHPENIQAVYFWCNGEKGSTREY
jgi:hypothetical protein